VEARKRVAGGTLPYMAPEHLQAFRSGVEERSGGRTPTIDRRADVYSLGVILYELLACRHPFTLKRGTLSELLPGMLAERSKAPALRPWNATVSPAVESIVRHCLEPDPA